MFLNLFTELRTAGLPVSLKEYLMLMDAMKHRVIPPRVDDFYYLSRATLVKDERYLDRFDRVFGHVFKGLEAPEGEEQVELPEEWLRKITEKLLTDEEKAQIEALGGWDAHNVTEDADLGLRLARHGYRTELITSVTQEEANCRFWPWSSNAHAG